MDVTTPPPTAQQTSSPYTIRQATPADYKFIAECNYNCAVQSQKIEIQQSLLQKGAQNAFENGLKYLIAMFGQVPVGLIGYQIQPDIIAQSMNYLVLSVYTVKEHRQKGVFKSLYSKVKQISQVKDPLSKAIVLYVEKENNAAQATYQKLGMVNSKLDFLEIDLHSH